MQLPGPDDCKPSDIRFRRKAARLAVLQAGLHCMGRGGTLSMDATGCDWTAARALLEDDLISTYGKIR